ncbi:hypothetical protein CRUP_002287, partial [Coryphaenoides rupestris]
VYDTPPMVAKGPPSGHDIYDTPPSSADKSTLLSQQSPIRDETYDVPPHFAKLNRLHRDDGAADDDDEPTIPEDVYDVPPPALVEKRFHGDRSGGGGGGGGGSLRSAGGNHMTQDIYDFPRERLEKEQEKGGDYIYDIPPQVVRDPHLPSDELTMSFKRLSASSTGSTRSNHSSSSLDMVPVRDSACPGSAPGSSPGKPLLLDLEAAMERLARLQQAVEASVSLLMSFIVGGWRCPGNLEGNLPAVRQASDRVRTAVRDFLEFARGAVANAGQATDRSLQAKLGRQVGKMEEVFQSLVRSGQALDAAGWSPGALVQATPTSGVSGGDDLDRLILTARGVPDDAKQLASFLHGNASLLFKRSGGGGRQQQQQQLPLPPIPGSEVGGHAGGERLNIQARPLPSPPKFTPAEEEGGERPYETTEEGWMEDYDYLDQVL